jgi:hypothetical protein
MMHLPEGVWLPHVIRINGADYQTLFDGITTDTISTFSNYIRFSTEIKDVKVGQPITSKYEGRHSPNSFAALAPLKHQP